MKWIVLAAMLAATPAIGQTMPDQVKLRENITSCWTLPPGATGSVTLKVLLNEDGSLAEEPQVIERASGQSVDALAESAIRAVKKCAHQKAFAFDPKSHAVWREMLLDFDPSDLGG